MIWINCSENNNKIKNDNKFFEFMFNKPKFEKYHNYFLVTIILLIVFLISWMIKYYIYNIKNKSDNQSEQQKKNENKERISLLGLTIVTIVAMIILIIVYSFDHKIEVFYKKKEQNLNIVNDNFKKLLEQNQSEFHYGELIYQLMNMNNINASTDQLKGFLHYYKQDYLYYINGIIINTDLNNLYVQYNNKKIIIKGDGLLLNGWNIYGLNGETVCYVFHKNLLVIRNSLTIAIFIKDSGGNYILYKTYMFLNNLWVLFTDNQKSETYLNISFTEILSSLQQQFG